MKIKNLVFRVDSGEGIGWGHTMRCFSLAQIFKEKNMQISFITRKIPNNISYFLKENGINVYYLNGEKYSWKNDAIQTKKIIENFDEVDWLIVDNYKLDFKWEKFLKPFVKKLMVIDDMTLRTHDCSLLLDQNYYEKPKNMYKNFVPKKCKMLIGPKFALLRSEFYQERKKLKEKNRQMKRIFISFGGSESSEIMKIIDVVKELDHSKINVDLLLTESSKYLKIKNLFSKFTNITIHHQNFSVVKLMKNADLAIGAGGSSTWERCCLGLPSIVTVSAKNQLQLTKEIEKKGCIINLGISKKITSDDYLNIINNLNKSKLLQMSKNALKLVDGKGTLRVTKEMLNLSKS